jgi:hypothetical protein
MKTDDEAARKARAQRLRKQIDQLKEGEGGAETPAAESPPSKSPRDLIHDKMRELDGEKDD